MKKEREETKAFASVGVFLMAGASMFYFFYCYIFGSCMSVSVAPSQMEGKQYLGLFAFSDRMH